MKLAFLQTKARNFLLLFVVVFSALLLFPAIVGAQTSSGITLQTDNRYPSPGEEVTISITSRLVNLNDKQILWLRDGEVFTSGIGLDAVTVSAPPAGEETQVTMQTATQDGPAEKTIVISANHIDLIWENTGSYVPPFYKGKALHPGWGSVQVTVIPEIYRPDGSTYSSDELVYTWEYNDLVYGNDSGRGQDSFTVNAVPRDGNRVGVEIETPEGDVVASETIEIPISDPELLLYEKDPLVGRRASRVLEENITLREDTVDITAVPYFSLTDNTNANKLTYNWELNGDTINTPEERSTIRLRRDSGRSGEANISLNISDNERIFPELSERITITF